MWTNFHTQFAVEIARQLSPLLRPRYAAFTEKRRSAENLSHGCVDLREVEHRELVTCIEILSPTNKRGQGREEYLKKRATLLRSEVNLVEIDLVRNGSRVPLRDPLPRLPYFVFLSRAKRRPITEYWPIASNTALPRVPIPLANSDPDVSLDLQAALNSVYDSFGYELFIDYSKPPVPPLTADAENWADRLLREKGKRR